MAEIKIAPEKNKGPKTHPVDPEALDEVKCLLGSESRQRDLLIEHLHKIQDHYQHISSRHLVAFAHEMSLAPAEVFKVVSFYHHFDFVKEGQTPPPSLSVRVCESLSCEMAGSGDLFHALEISLGEKVRVRNVPCVGRCQYAPVAVVGQSPVDFAVAETVIAAVENNDIKAKVPKYITFEQYQANGGYQTLKQVLEGIIPAESIIQQMENSGLRGLGGAGFPVAKKWRIVKGFDSPRFMAVNIDEGEPGTFKDRHYLEKDPHRFLEGVLIAASAVGCDEIYLYLRDEYAGCRAILTREIANLQNNPPSTISKIPPIHLRRGAGAYICGEESAMVESIEGKRGLPRLKPPFLSQVGLFGRPTLEHNMETCYWIRDIIEKGPEWFTSQGRNKRKGFRSFSISGRINKPGVHLAPAGITMRELIDEYCGGMREGHEFYGYFPGGASGGILPATMADIPMDFDTLDKYGCYIGSAGVVVFSHQDSARELALNAMKFFEKESCGQCTSCRAGTAQAAKLMEEKSWNRSLLKELSSDMIEACRCGLGQAAPNPLLCVMKYFPDEL